MGLLEKNTNRKADKIAKYINGPLTLLDFGCGDLSLAQELYKRNKKLKITGIEVIDFKKRFRGINFTLFDGKIIPYKDKTFDVVLAYNVFHHTENPEWTFSECARVAKKIVIFIEPIYRFSMELPGMILTDWLFNVWKGEDIPMKYTFRSPAWWKEIIKKYKFHLKSTEDVEPMPWISPTGRSTLFYIER